MRTAHAPHTSRLDGFKSIVEILGFMFEVTPSMFKYVPYVCTAVVGEASKFKSNCIPRILHGLLFFEAAVKSDRRAAAPRVEALTFPTTNEQKLALGPYILLTKLGSAFKKESINSNLVQIQQ